MISDCRKFHSKTVFRSSKVLMLSAFHKNIEYSCFLRLFTFFCSMYINISYLLLQMYSWFFSFTIPEMYLTGRSVFSMKNYSSNPALLMHRISREILLVRTQFTRVAWDSKILPLQSLVPYPPLIVG